jgi:hypothetical protein
MKWPPGKGSHFMKNRKAELTLGFVLFVIGTLLLWDAYDNRGLKMLWPLGGIMPF